MIKKKKVKKSCKHKDHSWQLGSYGHHKICTKCGKELEWIGYCQEELDRTG